MSDAALVELPVGGAEQPAPPAVDTPAAEPAPYWPADWQQKMAKEFGGDDDKAVDKELKRIQRLGDPSKIYGKMRELDSRFSAGGLVKVPGKDAKPEERAAFNKALGVPDKPEDYFQHITLDNGAVLGEADKPLATSFAASMHEAGAPPAVVNRALNWYFKGQEEAAAKLDQDDETFRIDSQRSLKEEFGPAFDRYRAGVAALFADAPGGANPEGDSLFARLMSGRTADGRIIGNDPDVMRLLVGIARELHPTATATDQANGSMVDRLAEIRKFKTDNPDEYDRDHKLQAEERELIDARLRMQGRGR